MKNKLLYLILILIIILGEIVYAIKGFNKELNYSNRQEFEISSASTLDEIKIEEIAKSVITDRGVKVQKLERFNNALEIISTSISEEEKENIINKINEECNESISNENTKIISITSTRIIDILKPYLLPAIITFSAVLLYFLFLYNKLGIKMVLIKAISIPILFEIAYYAIIAITRIPFGRITNSLAIGIYILSIGALSICFQNEKEKNIMEEKNKKENDE